MSGIPETFDMAKRIGIFVYIARRTRAPMTFEQLFELFSLDRSALYDKIQQYRNDCSNVIARNKFRIGIPNATSKTSFSKYVRVAHGLEIINSDFEAGIRWVRPNVNTEVIRLLSSNEYYLKSFELNVAEKLLVFDLLLERDFDLFYPLIRALDRLKGETGISFLDHMLLIQFLEFAISQLESALKSPTIGRSRLNASIKRKLFFTKNKELLEDELPPKRGLLHMIEPRLHWCLDLGLVDLSYFCEQVRLLPAQFWDECLKQGTRTLDEELHLDLMSRYFKYLMEKWPTYIDQSLPYQWTERIIEDGLKELREIYGRLVPVDAFTTLVSIRSSIATNRFVDKKEIAKITWVSGGRFLRSWRAGNGFIVF